MFHDTAVDRIRAEPKSVLKPPWRFVVGAVLKSHHGGLFFI